MINISDWLNEKGQQYEALIQEAMFRMRCCIPAVVQSYNGANNTVSCQPTIREKLNLPDGSTQYVNLPLLINVPVLFPGSMNYQIKFPVQPGDEVLVFFSDLSLDNFWEKANVQNPIEQRRHDLSDGLAFPVNISIPANNATKITEIEFTSTDIKFKAGSNSTTLSALISGGGGGEGTVTSVRVRATSPVQSSESGAQTSVLDTTISLADGYGDTKNPYGAKNANKVLAGPSSGSDAAPSFRALTADDIPSITKSKISDFPNALIGTTSNTTPTQVLTALQDGRPIYITHMHSTYGLLAATYFDYSAANNILISNIITSNGWVFTLSGLTTNDTWAVNLIVIPQSPSDINAQAVIQTSGILVGDGFGNVSAAVSGTDIKTVNNNSLLGSGNISISGGSVSNLIVDGSPSTTIASLSDLKTQLGTWLASMSDGSYACYWFNISTAFDDFPKGDYVARIQRSAALWGRADVTTNFGDTGFGEWYRFSCTSAVLNLLNGTWMDPVFLYRGIGLLTTTRPTSADSGLHIRSGDVNHMIATSSMVTNKPSEDGHILTMNWDNSTKNCVQFFIPNLYGASYEVSGKRPQVRGYQESADQWGPWENVALQSDITAAIGAAILASY